MTCSRVPPVECRWLHREPVALHLDLEAVTVPGTQGDPEATSPNPLEQPAMRPGNFLNRRDPLLNSQVFDRTHSHTAEPEAIRSSTAPS